MNKFRLYLIPLVLLLVFLVSGCATTVPSAIQQKPAQALSVSQAKQDIERYVGRDIRWGGEIIYLENGSNSTDMAVLATALGSSGKPKTDAALDARFIARVAGFLDPAEYAEGRWVTVTGVVTGVETRLVGEYAYPYTLVEVQAYHLWPKEKPRVNNYYYSDPFYYHYPWHRYGPWGRYPYWW